MTAAIRLDEGATRGWKPAVPVDAAWLAGASFVLLLQTALILGHEPFVDEWQALQIAVQAPDLASLLAALRYEGHPPLWHLVLRVVAQLVGPHNALAVSSLVFGLATQALILFRSPFPRWLRLALALSEPILFEYGTISRSYTLGVMLTFWAMATWDGRRLFWLPIALLPAVEFFFGLISLALLALRIAERRIWWPGIAGWVVVGLFAAWAVIPAPDFVPVYHPARDPVRNAGLLLLQFSIVAVPFQWADGPLWNAIPQNGLFLMAWVPFALVCLDQARRHALDAIAIAGFFLVLLFFYAFLYVLANRHLMLLGVLLVALQWRRSLRGEPIRWPFAAWLAVGAGCGLFTAAVNLATPFDTAERAARVIRDRGLAGEHWVALPAQHGQGISATTGVLFEGMGLECMNDFIRWNFRPGIGSAAAYRQWLDDAVRREGRFYLISQFAAPAGAPVVLLAHVPPGYDGKAYYLYEVGAGEARKRLPRPRCVPGMRPFPPRSGQAAIAA